jgi:hypothetical protein
MTMNDTHDQSSETWHEGTSAGKDEPNGAGGHNKASETLHKGTSEGDESYRDDQSPAHAYDQATIVDKTAQQTRAGKQDEGDSVPAFSSVLGNQAAENTPKTNLAKVTLGSKQRSDAAADATGAASAQLGEESASSSALAAETNVAGSEANQDESEMESGPGSGSWSGPATAATTAGSELDVGDSTNESGSASVAEAEATKGAPNSKPSGETEELKLVSVSIANMPSSTPTSPVEVTAASSRKGIGRTIVILSYLVGFYFVL